MGLLAMSLAGALSMDIMSLQIRLVILNAYRNTVNLQSINAALTITVMESTEAPAIHVMVIVMESSWEFRWLAVFFSASYGFLIKDLGLPAKPNIIIHRL